MTKEMKDAVDRLRLNLYKAVMNISDDALEQIIYESLPKNIKFNEENWIEGEMNEIL